MSMQPFLAHASGCSVCRGNPHLPCATGAPLLKEGAERLTRRLIHDPRRARA